MYYILLAKTKAGLNSQYTYLTTIAAESGETVKKSFTTLEAAQDYVQEMITSGNYSLNDLIVVKGVTVTAGITLAEETA